MLAAPQNTRELRLYVIELFTSIQGESTWAGCPCAFIRLAGCSVGCSYCDTQYAREPGQPMSIEAILAHCCQSGYTLAEITGGEPLEQANTPALADCLLEAGFTVLCETSGTQPVARLPRDVIKIMDLKCPGSGVADRNDWSNIPELSPRDEVKFVISDRADYEWSRAVLHQHALAQRCHAVLFSPAFGRVEPAELAAWILEDRLPARFQLPIHKYIWPPGQRGV